MLGTVRAISLIFCNVVSSFHVILPKTGQQNIILINNTLSDLPIYVNMLENVTVEVVSEPLHFLYTLVCYLVTEQDIGHYINQLHH